MWPKKMGPKLLTSLSDRLQCAGTYQPTNHFTCHVQWDNSKSRNKVLIIEIHHCQNARDVIWTISMFTANTVPTVRWSLSISHCNLGMAIIKACPCSHQNTVLRVTVLCLSFINPKTTTQILQTPHPIHIIILALPMMMIVTCST